MPVTHYPSRGHLAREVDAARTRIRAADPQAYGGFVKDAAILAVARRAGVNWRVVYRAWRELHPSSDSGLRGIPWDARQVSDAAKRAA